MRTATILVSILLAAGAGTAFGQETSCIGCHGNADFFDEAGLQVVKDFEKDVHAAAGLSCHNCHGGNPDPALAEDLDGAKDESFAGGPFVGAPERAGIPAFCGRCHSDPEYMKRFRPDLRIDQEEEYWTSFHGRALREGNGKVATCVDCHSKHGMLAANDPNSPVYPTRVAETCRRCHSDPEHMAGATYPDGEPLPTDQYALWRRSVHANALLVRGDFSAPTCNDCHGNHGAVPPGVESIAFVCGQCHSREARLFRASRKHAKLEEHREYLQEAGDEGCAACHEPPEPPAELRRVRALSECAICHGNHAVNRATVAILANLPETPCAFCHEGSGPLAEEIPELEAQRQHYEEMRDQLVATARADGLEDIDLFNQLVDDALALAFHTLPADAGTGEPGELRPEFGRLFEKFRIGKSYYDFDDPDSGGTVRASIYRCSRCHWDQEITGEDDPGGLETARQILDRMRELTALTARAERQVLAARRGGVETRAALEEIDQAVDAQIGLEVLFHTFDTAEGGQFSERQKEGLEHASAALHAAREALDELSARRWWLLGFLVFSVLVAIGLALKIRELSRHEVDEAERSATG